MSEDQPVRRCSFCGVEHTQAGHLFLGPGVAICDLCTTSCWVVLHEHQDQREIVEPERLAAAIAQDMRWGPTNIGAAINARFRCEYCSRSLLESLDAYYSWQIDHIMPGGGDELENCALSCQPCNHLKHTYRPAGTSRDDRIADARAHVQRKRAGKEEELQRLRQIIRSSLAR